MDRRRLPRTVSMPTNTDGRTVMRGKALGSREAIRGMNECVFCPRIQFPATGRGRQGIDATEPVHPLATADHVTSE